MADQPKTVLILGKIADAGCEKLRADGGYKLIERPDHAEDRFEVAGQADAIIVRMTAINPELLSHAPNLKFVARHGVGYDTVDVPALTERGIPLAVTGDVNSGAVAEHTLTLMLALAKKTVEYDRAMRADNFAIRDTFSAIELRGRNVFLVGFGRIGRKVADMCLALGMTVTIYDPYLKPEAIAGLGFKLVADLSEGLASADFVNVHAPLTPQTRHIISAETVAQMKPGARVINVARGGLVDEKAVLKALNDGHLHGAGFDVFENEPPTSEDALLQHPLTIVSPHCAAFTIECADRMALSCAENVMGFFNGSLDPALVINKGTYQAA